MQIDGRQFHIVTNTLRALASTWGFDGERVVYLVRFNPPLLPDGACSKCSFVVAANSKDRDKEWEEHCMTHRVWFYSDNQERFYGGLTQHRLCDCDTLFNKHHSLWCEFCGGYISVDKIEDKDKAWLRSNRISKTTSGIPLVWD